jgi:hypothetical protein
VVAIYSLNSTGAVINIAPHSSSFVFIGQPATINSANGDHITASVTASLATTAFLGTAGFDYGICDQLNGTGPIGDIFYLMGEAGSLQTPFNTSLTTELFPAGSHKIGFCVKNWGSNQIDEFGLINGWIMVTR